MTTDEPGVTIYGGRRGTRANLEDLARATGTLEAAAGELEAAATCCLQAEWHLRGVPRSVFQVDTDEALARSRALAALAEVRRSPVSPGSTAARVTELSDALRRAARLYVEAESGASGLLGQLSRLRGWIVGGNPILVIGEFAVGSAVTLVAATAVMATVVGAATTASAAVALRALAESALAMPRPWTVFPTIPTLATIAPLPQPPTVLPGPRWPRPASPVRTAGALADVDALIALARGTFEQVPRSVNEVLTARTAQIEALLSGVEEELATLLPGFQMLSSMPAPAAARVVAAVLALGPNRPLTVIPSLDPSHPPAPRDLGDVVDRLVALYPEAGGTAGTMQVEQLDHPDGTRTWVVEIPGTQETSFGGTNPMDMTTNVRLMAGLPNDLTALATRALEQAGAGADEPILLVGHSQGGMAAMALAASATFTSRYHVAAVATLGSPVAAVSVPRTIQVLNIEHTEDFVPTTDGASNPDEPNRTTVRRELRKSSDPQDRLAGHSPADAHRIGTYARTATVVDDDAGLLLDGWREAASKVLGDGTATVTSREFTGVRGD